MAPARATNEYCLRWNLNLDISPTTPNGTKVFSEEEIRKLRNFAFNDEKYLARKKGITRDTLFNK